MVIVETSIFTKQIKTLVDDETYRLLQNDLIADPTVGKLISGSGGLRKVRWKIEGGGKRGGIRVIYYWASNKNQIYMLLAYQKNEMENIPKKQLAILRKLVEEEFNNERRTI